MDDTGSAHMDVEVEGVVGQVPTTHRSLTQQEIGALVLRVIAADSESLLRLARRNSLCADDAQDAYQRGLEIFMRHAARLDPDRAGAWLHTVVKHEAMAVRRSRAQLLGADEVDFDVHESHSDPLDEQIVRFERVSRSAEALKRLKPQEVRALWLKALGNSYSEIQTETGWSYTNGVQRTATSHSCDFTLPTPCSDAPATTHTVALTSVPDGSHSLQLGAIDAGGDSVLSPVQTLKTDGTAPQAPEGLSVAGGSGWQAQSAFDLTWQNPGQGQAAPIVAARWRLCPAGTIVGCATGRQTGANLQQLSVEPPADGEWLASIWAEDDAGNQDPARSAAVMVRRDVAAPGPPEGLAGGGTNGTNDFSLSWSNPVDSGAPVQAAWLRLCRAGSTTECTVTRSETQPGISGLSGITVPGAGSYEARVVLEDQAGNSAETQAAGPVALTFDPGASAGPGGGDTGAGGGDPLVTTPSPAPKPQLVSSGLRVRSARLDRRRRIITVSGTIATAATGRVRVVYRTRRGRRLLSAAGRAKVRNGRWTVRLRLGPTVARARAGRVEASFAQAPPLAAGRTSRTVALKRR